MCFICCHPIRPDLPDRYRPFVDRFGDDIVLVDEVSLERSIQVLGLTILPSRKGPVYRPLFKCEMVCYSRLTHDVEMIDFALE